MLAIGENIRVKVRADKQSQGIRQKQVALNLNKK